MEGGEDSESANPDLSFEGRGFLLAMRKNAKIRDLKTFLPISLGIHLLCFSVGGLILKDYQDAPLRTMPVEVSLFLPTSQALAEDRLPAKVVLVASEKVSREKDPEASLSQREPEKDVQHPQTIALLPPLEEEATISQEVAEHNPMEELERLDQNRDKEKGEENRIEASTEPEVLAVLSHPTMTDEGTPSLLKENVSSDENLALTIPFPQASQSREETILEVETREGPERITKAGLSSSEKNLLVQPRYLRNPKPVYPEEAREKGYGGEVMLRVEVLPTGEVGRIELQRSSGYDLLDRSALGAVRRWRFLPAKNGEIHVSSWVHVPIKFQLE